MNTLLRPALRALLQGDTARCLGLLYGVKWLQATPHPDMLKTIEAVKAGNAKEAGQAIHSMIRAGETGES
jgi:hypothetical protein